MSLGLNADTVRGPAIWTTTDSWIGAHGSFATNAAWGTANRAIYVPVEVPARVTVRELAYGCSSTASGNIDIGIYDSAGTRLVSTGSTAKASTSGMVVVGCDDTTIGPGLYYLALNDSTTTDDFLTLSEAAPIAAARGVLSQEVGDITLPATATWVIGQAATFVPTIAALLVTEF